MSLFARIAEETPLRLKVKTRKCAKPTPCGDRMRDNYRPDSPTDKMRPEAARVALLGNSLKSALMCRDVADITKYLKLLSGALDGIKKAVSSPKAQRALDYEQKIKCPTKHEDTIPGGKGDKLKTTDVDPDQLKLGVSVEMEHTTNRDIATEIALDHLAEDPKYYTRLKKVHKEQVDFPGRYSSVPTGSNRTGIGTAPPVDARQELENQDRKQKKPFPRRKSSVLRLPGVDGRDLRKR
jgi:hypothetical protein